MFKIKPAIKILVIIIGSFFLRLYGINWDQGFHLHPDERMITMVTDSIKLFSNLNPHFFNYGTLPIYLLKGVSELLNLSTYDGMLYVGRIMSTIFDTITLLIIYAIAKNLFKKDFVALFSIVVYSIIFFPIQNAHFYTVDTLLTCLTTLLIFWLLKFVSSLHTKKQGSQSLYHSVITGAIFAAMISTKFSSIVFLPFILIFLFLAIKLFDKTHGKQWSHQIFALFIFSASFLIFNFIFMPYAFLEFHTFISNISQQIKMNSDPYIFPYTLQYVGTLPYFYYLKNIFLWGMGPFMSILSLIGFILLLTTLKIKSIFHMKSSNKFQISNYQCKRTTSLLFIIFFYLLYFLIIGKSSVKFMRYMLPIYPFLAILAGYGIYQIKHCNFKIGKFILYVFLTLQILWTMLFVNIYSQENTRVSATDWILRNISYGAIVAVEHWDDQLPLYNAQSYKVKELTLYDQPDDANKWIRINEVINQSQYIIVASNRLSTPLQKLSDCSKYKLCYPNTAEYYKKLFSGKLGFKKVAEFSNYPELKILNFKFKIEDSSADESFTVYDHPRIMIFKRIN